MLPYARDGKNAEHVAPLIELPCHELLLGLVRSSGENDGFVFFGFAKIGAMAVEK